MSAPESNQAPEEGLSILQIIVLVIAGFAALVLIAKTLIISKPFTDDGGADARIEAVARIELAGGGGAAGGRSGEELFNAACAACHGSGVLGAPKAHDAGAWGSRQGGNPKALLASAIKGKGAMPPKGGADATDEELLRAIQFMVK